MNGVVLSEFAPPGETITADSYCGLLQRLKERVRRKRPELWARNEEGDRTMILHHDNASSHTAVPTLALIGSSDIQMLAHPPYSPDLAPCNFFLFPRLKAELRGRRFRGVVELQHAVKQGLKAIGQEEYSAAIQTLPVRWMKCVKSEGQYFECQHIPINPEEDHGLIFAPNDSDSEESDEE